MDIPLPSVPTPPGLAAIYSTLRKAYPDQSNPLQVTALVKYWLGGPDPLDFISMFSNPGNPLHGIPPHWHYVSSGLSDLHGDGRVHEFRGAHGLSGYGFELTFRLKKEPGQGMPPSWPAELMQELAKYVFRTNNSLQIGDHVSWNIPLDHTHSRLHFNSNSNMRHILLAEDPQLTKTQSSLGTLAFVQIVGICDEELHAAQQWNGFSTLELLRRIPYAGGPWLITDMERMESIFELEPSLQDEVTRGLEREGSTLSGVNAKCYWEELKDNSSSNDVSHFNSSSIIQPARMTDQMKNQNFNKFSILPPIDASCTSKQHYKGEATMDRSSACSSATSEISRTRSCRGVCVRLNIEAASLLPLAFRGRLRHGRHFTFQSSHADIAITLVSTSVTGSIATREHPYSACGNWLQLFVGDELIGKLEKDLDELAHPEEVSLPREYTWPEANLKIVVLPNE